MSSCMTNQASFHLWWKENLLNHQKVSKYYEHDCLQSFFPLFMSLSTASVVKNSHILAGIYFIFLKNVLDQAWKVFNAKFGPQQKDRGSSYQVRQILALFYKLVAPILGFKCVKDLRFAKVIKQIKFEGVWGKLKVFHKIFEKSSSFHVK